jgi:hypothetical protein
VRALQRMSHRRLEFYIAWNYAPQCHGLELSQQHMRFPRRDATSPACTPLTTQAKLLRRECVSDRPQMDGQTGGGGSITGCNPNAAPSSAKKGGLFK